MAQSLSQGLSFQGHPSPQNGLTQTPTLCKCSLNWFCYVFADSPSVLQHCKMAGLMTSLVQSGLRNHLFHRLPHRTYLANRFCLSLMVMAHMKLLRSSASLRQIIILFCAFHLTPRTSCSLSTLVSSDHSNVPGWIVVMTSRNLLGQKCQKRISSRNTCRSDGQHSVCLPLSQHSRKVVSGPLIRPSSQMMILHPAFLIPQKPRISHKHLRSCSCHHWMQIWTLTTVIWTWTLTVIPMMNLIQNLENYMEHHTHIPQLEGPILQVHHHLHQLLVPPPCHLQWNPTPLPITHQHHHHLKSLPFPQPNSIMIWSFSHGLPSSSPIWQCSKATSRWSSLSYKMRSAKITNRPTNQASGGSLMWRHEF